MDLASLVDSGRLEKTIIGGLALGVSMAALHKLFAKRAEETGGRVQRLAVEVQRKSFHIIGGCLVCGTYHWGLKWGWLAPAFHATPAVERSSSAMDGGTAFVSLCFVSWTLEASRILIPAVNSWYLSSFKGLIREKEKQKAAGIAYFLPGSMVAMLAGPADVANLGVLYLSLGDAAASMGTAVGSIPVGTSARKVEGSVGCFCVCSALGVWCGLPSKIALAASALVTCGELLAEVIGLDDNLVIPVLGVLGIRMALNPQYAQMGAVMGCGLLTGVTLGALVGATTAQKAAQPGTASAAAAQSTVQSHN